MDETEGQRPAAPPPGAVCPSEALEVKPYAQAPQEQVRTSRDKMKRYHKHDLQAVRFYFANYTKWKQAGLEYVNKTRDDEGCHVQL
eukprot:2396042-Pyramimonas_sp.AAC.1